MKCHYKKPSINKEEFDERLIIASDLESGGGKKKYLCFEDYNEYIEYLEKNKGGHNYEIIYDKSNYPVYMYYDLDKELSEELNGDIISDYSNYAEEVSNRFIEYVRDYLKEKTGVKINFILGENVNVGITELNKSLKPKLSIHIKMNIILNSMRMMSKFQEGLLSYIGDDNMFKKNNGETIIDDSVFKDFQVFRLPYSSKRSKKLIMYPSKGSSKNINDYLINVIEDNYQSIIDIDITELCGKDEVKEEIKKEVKEVKEVKKEKEVSKDIKLVRDLVNILNKKRADNYEDWIKLGWCLHNINKEELLIDWKEFSKESGKYNEGECEKLWLKMRCDGLNIGTLKMWAKKDNSVEYYKIIGKNINGLELIKDCLCTHADIASVIVKYLDGDYVYDTVSNSWYIYNGVYWYADKKGYLLHNLISENIRREFSTAILEVQSKELENALTIDNISTSNSNKKDSTKLTNLKQIFYKLGDCSFVDKVKYSLENKLSTIFSPKLDNKGHLFAFNNKILDLVSNEWIEPRKEDYISITTGYDYIEPSEEKKFFLQDELIKKVFSENYKGERDLYMTILATGLEGSTLEKSTIANGSGGNGKSVINEIIHKTLGNYSYTGNAATLTNALDDKANPALANLHKKRIAFFTEADERKNLCVSVIKLITGGSEINARLCHSNNTKTKLCCTCIIECNTKPKFDKVDGGIQRRLIDCPFRNKFCDKKDIEREKKNSYEVFEANSYLKDNMFHEEYKYAMFEILRDYYKIYRENNRVLIIPDTIIERNESYLKQSDEFFNWFNNYFEEKEGCFVSVKNVYEEFKTSEYFRNLKNCEKKNLNFTNFKEKILNNLYIKDLYRDRHKFYVGKIRKEVRNVILNYCIKDEEVDSDSICDF